MNQALLYMSNHEAAFGFKRLEVDVFKTKLSTVYKEINPDKNFEALSKIVEIKALPDILTALKNGKISLDKVLEIRATDEIVEFREWINSLSHENVEEEIQKYFGKYDKWFKKNFSGGLSKTLRFLLTGGLSVAEPISGAILSGIDTFILNKALKQEGPISFINKRYPTIYKNY